jgi:serine/threonine protein phosphatase PrpC
MNDIILKKRLGFNWLVGYYDIAPEYARNACKDHYEKIGYDIRECGEYRYLEKKNKNSNFNNWLRCSGGSTMTILLCINNDLYISNTGDSDALLFCNKPILNTKYIKYLGDSAIPPVNKDNNKKEENINTNILQITSNQSLELPFEFERLRKFKKSNDNPNMPYLNIVYDHNYMPVFDVDSNGNSIRTKNIGSYYRNVKSEFATIVQTPDKDSLSFSRSIGDFYIQQYGVTNKPEIQYINLEEIISDIYNLTEIKNIDTDKNKESIDINDINISEIPDIFLGILVASDGVHDNWINSDICNFLFHESCISAYKNTQNTGSQKVVNAFINRNEDIGIRNFGKSRDNATAILAICNITKK